MFWVALLSMTFCGPAQDALSDLPDPQAPVNAQFVVRPLIEVLEDLGRQMNVPLRAGKSIEKDRIILVCENRPRVEVLRRLAKHFGWTWQKEEGGYRLIQTPEQARAERDLGEQQIADPVLRLQENMKQLLKESDQLTVEEALAKSDELYQQFLRTEVAEVGPTIAEQVRASYRRVELRYNLFLRIAVQCLAGLDRDQAVALGWNRRVVFSNRPTPRQMPMPPGALAEVGRLLQLLYVAARDRVGGQVDFKQYPLRQIWMLGDSIYDPERLLGNEARDLIVRVALQLYPTRGGRTLAVLGTVDVISPDGFLLVRGHEADFESPREIFVPRDPPEELAVPIGGSPLLQYIAQGVVEEGFEAGRFWRKGSPADPVEDYGRALAEISRLTGVPVVADAYDDLGASMPSALGAKTCGEIVKGFDRRTWMPRWEWSYDDGWLSLRMQNWPLARASSADRERLFRLRDRFFERGGVDLDDLVATFANSTPRTGFFGFAVGGKAFDRFLQLWASVPVSLRMAALQTGRLRYGDLPLQARSWFDALLYSPEFSQPQWRRYVYEEAHSTFLDKVFSVYPEPAQAPFDRSNWRDDEITQIRPITAQAEDSLWIVSGEYPGVMVFAESGRIYVHSISWLAAASDSLAALYGVGARYLPATIREYAIILRVDHVSKYVSLSTYRFDPSAKPTTWMELPQSVRTKIAEAASKMQGGGGDARTLNGSSINARDWR